MSQQQETEQTTAIDPNTTPSKKRGRNWAHDEDNSYVNPGI
jgi:hypothetical protein